MSNQHFNSFSPEFLLAAMIPADMEAPVECVRDFFYMMLPKGDFGVYYTYSRLDIQPQLVGASHEFTSSSEIWRDAAAKTLSREMYASIIAPSIDGDLNKMLSQVERGIEIRVSQRNGLWLFIFPDLSVKFMPATGRLFMISYIDIDIDEVETSVPMEIIVASSCEEAALIWSFNRNEENFLVNEIQGFQIGGYGSVINHKAAF